MNITYQHTLCNISLLCDEMKGTSRIILINLDNFEVYLQPFICNFSGRSLDNDQMSLDSSYLLVMNMPLKVC